jgi:hypothetical protein
VLCRKIVADFFGLCAEQGNSLWAEYAEDIEAKAVGMYSYHCVVIVTISVHELVVNHNVS